MRGNYLETVPEKEPPLTDEQIGAELKKCYLLIFELQDTVITLEDRIAVLERVNRKPQYRWFR